MMWLRRILAVVLAVIFIVAFISTLLVSRVNATVGNPGFYTGQLQQADVYNYLYDKVLPSAVSPTNLKSSRLPLDITPLQPYLVPAIEQTLPRQWVQTQVELSINTILPYVLGDIDQFSLRINLKDRLQAGDAALKNALNKEGVFPALYSQMLDNVPASGLSNIGGLSLSNSQIKTLAQTAFPPEWALQQVNQSLDTLSAYLTVSQAHFTVQVKLTDRMDSLESALLPILKDKTYYDYVVANILVPAVKQKIQGFQLPAGTFNLTDAEIKTAVQQIFPLDWYQAHIADIIHPVFSYLKGADQTLKITLSVSDRKTVAVQVMTDLINKKFSINLGTLTQSIATQLVNQMLPDQVNLMDYLGSDIQKNLADARNFVSKGITYTDADLEKSLGTSFLGVAGARQVINDGLVFTEKDFRNLVQSSGSTTAQLDRVRSQIGTVRKLIWVGWLVLALLLLAIGALGARQWRYKMIWAAGVLAVASLVTFIIVGPVFSATAQPQINSALAHMAGQSQSVQGLLEIKAAEITQNAVDSFIGGLKVQSGIFLGISLLAIAFAILWPRLKPTNRT
jgi:hypothetical protein